MGDKLKKLILENPELPILVMVSEDDCDFYEFSTLALDVRACSIEELVLYDNRYVEEDELEDYLRDSLCDLEEYKNLSDEEFDKAVIKHMESNYQTKKYIVIWAR